MILLITIHWSIKELKITKKKNSMHIIIFNIILHFLIRYSILWRVIIPPLNKTEHWIISRCSFSLHGNSWTRLEGSHVWAGVGNFDSRDWLGFKTWVWVWVRVKDRNRWGVSREELCKSPHSSCTPRLEWRKLSLSLSLSLLLGSFCCLLESLLLSFIYGVSIED